VGALWWAGCGEHVWGIVSCGPSAAPQSLVNPPPRIPVATNLGCGNAQISWGRTAGAMGLEEIEFRVYFAPSTPGTGTKPDAAQMELAGTTVQTSFGLVGLQQAHAYIVCVAVNRGGKWSGLSAPLTIRTLSPVEADRHALELLQLSVTPAADRDPVECTHLDTIEVGALPDCHAATDFQSVEMTWALEEGGSWSPWNTITPRVQQRRFQVAVTDPLRLYRLRVVLHSDVRLNGRPSAPLLVDQAHSLLGSSRWPAVAPSEHAAAATAAAFVPSIRPLGAAAFEVAVPSPLSSCHDGVVWALAWRLAGEATIETFDEADRDAFGQSAFGRPFRHLEDAARVPLPRHGLAVLEKVEKADGTASLVAKTLRCPRGGCHFRLLPHNLHGWATPSAETAAIASPPLARRPPGLAVFELRFRGWREAAQEKQYEQQLEARLRTALRLGEALRVLEVRFRCEYVVVGVPTASANSVVATWLQLLDAATTGRAGSVPSESVALLRELEPQADLLEILADGTAVRRVAVRSAPPDSSASISWLLGCLALAIGLVCSLACLAGQGVVVARRMPRWVVKTAGGSYATVKPLQLEEEEDAAEADHEIEDVIDEIDEANGEREVSEEEEDGPEGLPASAPT